MRRGGGAEKVVGPKSIIGIVLKLDSNLGFRLWALMQWHQSIYDFMLLSTFVNINSLLDFMDYEYKDTFPYTK